MLPENTATNPREQTVPTRIPHGYQHGSCTNQTAVLGDASDSALNVSVVGLLALFCRAEGSSTTESAALRDALFASESSLPPSVSCFFSSASAVLCREPRLSSAEVTIWWASNDADPSCDDALDRPGLSTMLPIVSLRRCIVGFGAA